jgi:tRNA A-37 threonylcarbamoyl transferase component Bud32
MDTASRQKSLTNELVQELADYRITVSPLNPGFQIENILPEIIECRIVKQNHRRQVYHLQTAVGGYFLKRSLFVRTKDRWRHFLLPRRRWAEWRNLHRLRQLQVPAARPLVKGQSKIRHPKAYFVMTEQVLGTHIPINSLTHARSLGQYAAFLHRRKIFHADFNRKNFVLGPAGKHFLLDAQEIYFLPWLPLRWRIGNLGRIAFNFCALKDPTPWVAELLAGYNLCSSPKVQAAEVIEAAERHRDRRLRSRSKRCCKNSTEFAVVKNEDWKGFRRKTFHWSALDLLQALEKGQPLKGTHVLSYRGVCIKKHPRRWFHADRCLISWKMSRALEVRGIQVPRSLGYFAIDDVTCFLADLLDDSCHLNGYLSSLADEQVKRKALKKLARWLREFHDRNIWQRDFKSSNILCQDQDYFMVDLDGVRIRRLSKRHKICNLAQLNASVSNAITIKDRLRFYHYYSADRLQTRSQRRAVYRKVWQIAMTKNTAMYGFFPEKLGLA